MASILYDIMEIHGQGVWQTATWREDLYHAHHHQILVSINPLLEVPCEDGRCRSEETDFNQRSFANIVKRGGISFKLKCRVQLSI